MTTETRNRIKAYKKALPELRERVVAVALLLAMSVSMLGSASFAWLTISRRPEVTGVSTTVAANGNLEIALATSDDEPEESQVGDSSAAQGQSITEANITWGNLVNLSDPSYGLENLVLRPARLNGDALLSNPLYGAEYTADGRVEKLNSSFRYTSWTEDENGYGYFGLSTQLGVRAISSTKLGITSGPIIRYLELQGTADTGNASAVGTFDGIMSNTAWMELLAKIMGFHMCSVLEPGKPDYADKTITYNELAELKKMYDQFILAFEQEAAAMATLMNFQLFALNGGDESKYIPYTKDTILTCLGNASGLRKNGTRSLTVSSGTGTAVITGIETFLYDYYMLSGDSDTLQSKLDENKATYAWQSDKLNVLINKLVDIGMCLIDVKNYKGSVSNFLNNFTSNPLSAAGYMNAECTATINNGVMYDFCKFTGAEMNVTKKSGSKTGLPIEVAMVADSVGGMKLGTTVYATIKTNAPTPADFTKDWNAANEINFQIDESQMTMQAQDTYALAVDLWVRTNAEASYLTLEGNILTESHEEPELGKDAKAEPVPLYTLTRSQEVADTNPDTQEEETVTVTTTYDLFPEKYEQDETTGYLRATADNEKWYDQATFAEFTLESGEVPSQKMETITTVIGYEGENRIWDRDDHANMTVDSTSQGSGSSYVYYVDSPEDMEQSKGVLSSMNVAFIDVDGNLLASAKMDTEKSYEENGRVIVPLVLDETTPTISVGDEAVPYITVLEKNAPMRITALVYLDGNKLSNDDVLAATDIHGQLNIQFGSSGELEASKNTELELAERSVSASVSDDQFSYDTDDDLTTTVSVLVAGEQPNAVSAFFIRKISDTQGSREPEMTEFRFDSASGTWKCDYTFAAPGTYILRTVQLDGQEYVLKNTPEVVVDGFTITSLTTSAELNSNRTFTIVTAENAATVDLTMTFASSDVNKMPRTVQGRFMRDGAVVNVNFVYDATTHQWKGKANFLTSGVYTLQHVVLDGMHTGLSEDKFITGDISLGMKVRVYNDLENKSFKFQPEEMTDEQKLLEMLVQIIDGSDNPISGLADLWLYYSRSDSALRTMDTKLEWDPSRNLYKGYLKTFEAESDTNVGAGIWRFNRVEVGTENKITNALVAPVFTLISPEPPEIVGVDSTSYIYTPEGNAKMGVTTTNAATAQLMALIEKEINGKTTQYYVAGRSSGESWFFDLPKDTTQDGNWSMKEVYVWNYYDEDNNYISITPRKPDGSEWVIENGATASQWVKAENGWSPIDKDACMSEAVVSEMKVVQTATPSFKAGQSKDFGKTDGKVTGTFMEEYEVSGLTVDMLDFEGKPLAGVSTITLEYSYGYNYKNYGGYDLGEGVSIPDSDVNFKVVFEQSDTGTQYVQKGSQKLRFAGSYQPKTLSFKSGDTTIMYGSQTMPLPANTPTFTVNSVTPTVTIDSIMPEGEHFTLDGEKEQVTVTSKIEGNEITIFPLMYNTGSGCDKEAYLEYDAQVDLSLMGLGKASKATLTFTTDKPDGVVRLYSGTSSKDGRQTNAYIWENGGSNTVKRFVGYINTDNCSSSADAGTLTSGDVVTLEYVNGSVTETYSVEIDVITIIYIQP